MKISTLTKRIMRENESRKDFLDKLQSCEDDIKASFVCSNKSKFLNSIPHVTDIPIEDYLAATIEELHDLEYAILETGVILRDIKSTMRYYFDDEDRYKYLDDFEFTWVEVLDFIRYPENKLEEIRELFLIYMKIPFLGDAYDDPEGGRSDYFLKGKSVFALGGDYKSVCRQACWMEGRLASMDSEEEKRKMMKEWLYELQRDYECTDLFIQFHTAWTLSWDVWNPSPIDYILFFLNRRSEENTIAIVKFVRYYLVRYTIWLSYMTNKYSTVEFMITHHYIEAKGNEIIKNERLLDCNSDFMMSSDFPFNNHFVSQDKDTVNLEIHSGKSLWKMRDPIPEMSITERIARAVGVVANSGLMLEKKEHVLIRYTIDHDNRIRTPLTTKAYVDLIHHSGVSIPANVKPTISSCNDYQLKISGDYPHLLYADKDINTSKRYKHIIDKFMETFLSC